jgi:hypothetical protein
MSWVKSTINEHVRADESHVIRGQSRLVKGNSGGGARKCRG